ncbi:MAG: hypothetical protein HOY78_11650 [Saccharothrix sp.]|nr:hypothetical protein [Saccharothrix sp.]
MGYDLHITRAEAWYDSEHAPIPQEEWERFARERPELTVDGWAYSRSEVGCRPIFACTVGDVVVSLLWNAGEVVVSGATTEAATGLRWVAEGMGARLVGDDGEAY